MKKLLSIIFFPFIIITAQQIGYVPYDHNIYPFLERMDALNIIEDYDPFEIPKTKNEIAGYLADIIVKKDKLDENDKLLLREFQSEFEMNLTSAINRTARLIPKFEFGYLLSNKEKYLFLYNDSAKFNLTLNFVGKYEQLFRGGELFDNPASLFRFGLSGEATFYKKVGIALNAQNGYFAGSRYTAENYKDLRYNFRFNLDPEFYNSTNFFDEAYGFITADFDFIKLKLGNDRVVFGYGGNKNIFSDNAPPMDYLQLNLKYKFFNFTFLHGKLIGNMIEGEDSLKGSVRKIDDKYAAYHRIGLNFSKHFTLGIGELVIYANRNIDFSYLNPINFYKSAEHNNHDRDNSLLFFDITNNSIDGLKISGTIIIDDLLFDRIGTSSTSNKFAYNLNIYSSGLYKLLPLDINLQYIRIDPYVYSHRFDRNKFTSLDFSVPTAMSPNSDLIFAAAKYRIRYDLEISAVFGYGRHGANIYDDRGNLIKNYGGSIHYGERTIDDKYVPFLSGIKEYTRQLAFKIDYEIINGYRLIWNLIYSNESKSNSHNKYFMNNFSLSLKF